MLGFQALGYLALGQLPYNFYSVSIAESAPVVDSDSATSIYAVSVSESINPVDAIGLVYYGSLSEHINISDAYTCSVIRRFRIVRINGTAYDPDGSVYYTCLAIDTLTGQQVEIRLP